MPEPYCMHVIDIALIVVVFILAAIKVTMALNEMQTLTDWHYKDLIGNI